MGGTVPINWATILTGLISAAILWSVRKVAALLNDYTAKSAEWRRRVEDKVDQQGKGLQATMRNVLVHNAEKYFERDWLTSEEEASWCDMHDRYSAMGCNGLIDSYRKKIEALPHRSVEDLVRGRDA